MRILVTGAGGQLGRALRRESESRRDVGGVSGEGGGDVLADAVWLFTDVGELDIADGDAVRGYLECCDAEVVVNCAAWTDVDGAECDREGAFRVNAVGPRVLAGAVRERNGVLVHVSTDFVFPGGDNGHGEFSRRTHPYTEDDIASPINVYGESKLAGERAVLESGCCGAVVRTSWLYSPWGRNFVKSILGAAEVRDELKVVDDQIGSPTSALSLAGAIVAMIGSGALRKAAEVYHFCDAGVVSRAGFASEIIRQAGLSTRVTGVSTADFESQRAGSASGASGVSGVSSVVSAARRPGYSALDTGKIARDFGIVARPWPQPLSEVLRELKTT